MGPVNNTTPAQEQQPQEPPSQPLVQQPGTSLPSYDNTRRLSQQSPVPHPAATTPGLDAWQGLNVAAIQFKGISSDRLSPLPAQLPTQPGQPLRPDQVRQSLRRLYATGLYKTIEVEGVRSGDSITLIFTGTPTSFIGTVRVHGINNDQLTSILIRATRLSPGSIYSDTKLQRAQAAIEQGLKDNGYYVSKVFTSVSEDPETAQTNLDFHVEQGKQVRIGDVAVTGDSGMSLGTFRKKAKLKEGSKVNRNTVSRGLERLSSYYQKKDRLEAVVRLQDKTFQPPINHLDYKFTAQQGPIVQIKVNGVKLSKGKVKTLVPVYEEGAVDEDLLNEGNRRIRDFYQRKGYFDVKVTHSITTGTPKLSVIVFDVQLGTQHTVDSVAVQGNKYFSTDILLPRLVVRTSSIFDHHGSYSAAFIATDIDTITALYQGNGFGHVTVTPKITDVDSTPGAGRKQLAHVRVNYVINEGVQQRIGRYVLVGNKQVPTSQLTPLLNTQSGQPYSSLNVTGDRDLVLGYYLSHGFDDAQVNITQVPEKANPNLIDVSMNITEGDQIFINRVLISGLRYTKPQTVEHRIFVHAGEPLNQTALFQTQRELYNLTLFNEVNTAVQNPGGAELRKNVLIQFTEGRRWDVTYGFGLQAQTGNPNTACLSPVARIALGLPPNTPCGPNGKFGLSPMVELQVSRINLFGTDKSASLKTIYGRLEQSATLTFNNPHLLHRPTLTLSLSGGYTKGQNITTFAASTLQGVLRVTQRPTIPTTLIYDFEFRRVKVDPRSIQVSPNLIPLLSQPVRVGGPGFTWIRDTRRPTALDARSGTYNIVQEFHANSSFGSEANFNRFDVSNSSYYTFGVRRWVIARNTRIAFERAYGNGIQELIPLPERLYAGGAQSLRGFGINAAGPRDSITGFPIGGAGAFVNSTEVRFPDPVLPYFGTNLGFVLFHDMGNVFTKGSDIWKSALRVRQPNSASCRDLSLKDQQQTTVSNSTGQKGTCNFNDFSQALGLGARYHTPVGPIRLDFSYNLNPPIYPILLDYNNPLPDGSPGPPRVGQAPHFNFFFSIGQAF